MSESNCEVVKLRVFKHKNCLRVVVSLKAKSHLTGIGHPDAAINNNGMMALLSRELKSRNSVFPASCNRSIKMLTSI